MTDEEAQTLLDLYNQSPEDLEDEERERHDDIVWRVQMKLIRNPSLDPAENERRAKRKERMAQLHPQTPRTPEEVAEYDGLFAQLVEEATRDQDRHGLLKNSPGLLQEMYDDARDTEGAPTENAAHELTDKEVEACENRAFGQNQPPPQPTEEEPE